MGNCCDNMLKYIVFLFNFCFFVTGCILIGVGAYVQIQMKDYFDFLGSPYLNSSIIFIIIGCVILVVAFFGCCGACTENACMLYTYATLMALILMVEIGLAVTIYIFRGDARQFVSEAMTKGMQNYEVPQGNPQTGHGGVTKTWDVVQADFQCCGVESYLDWKNTTFGAQKNVPMTCCKTPVEGCGNDIFSKPLPDTIINTQGCFKKMEELIVNNVAAVAGVGVGIAVFQVLAVIVSCFLAASMRRKSNYV